jgi:hypothetical protein
MRLNKIISQCFSNCGPWTTGGPLLSEVGFERKSVEKIVSGTERMKNTHTCTSVLNLPLLVDLQHKVGALALSVSYCSTIIILENILN